jgi:predicted RNA-binding Zn ribbon-like protein
MTPHPDFAFIGGDPAADFVNTADWTGQGPANERLPDYAALVRWAAEAGLVPPATAERLRRAGAARPRQAAAVHAGALRVREVLRALLAGTASGRRVSGPLRQLNALLGETMGRRELVESVPARWTWRGMDQRLDSVLWPVIRSAAELLASPEAKQVRMCAGPECGWVYVDRSRNGLRRWCRMRTCGTREKSRRRRTAV